MTTPDTATRVQNLTTDQLRFLRLGAQLNPIDEPGKQFDAIAKALGISTEAARANFRTIALLCGFSPRAITNIKTPYELSVRSGIGWYKELVGKKPFEHMRGDLALLSSREREVLEWIAFGYTNKEIASQLTGVDGQKLSPHTVAGHVRSLYEKLAIDNHCDATRIAIGEGIVRVEEGDALQPLITAYCNLSPAERKVFEFTALGLEVEAIAEIEKIKNHTITHQRKTCYKKLGIDNKVDATRMWVALRIEADRLQAEEKQTQVTEGTYSAELGACATSENSDMENVAVSSGTQGLDDREQHIVLSESAAGSFANRFANRHSSLARHYR